MCTHTAQAAFFAIEVKHRPVKLWPVLIHPLIPNAVHGVVMNDQMISSVGTDRDSCGGSRYNYDKTIFMSKTTEQLK